MNVSGDKRRRLTTLSNWTAVDNVSISSLRKVIQMIRTDGVDITKTISNREMAHAYNFLFDEVSETIPLQLADAAGTWDWVLAEPARLIQLSLSESPELRRLYLNALRKHPCSESAPWNVVFAYDEFAPGDKLKVNNRRKTMNGIMNFAELGQVALTCTATWVPICVRAAMCDSIEGGWSAMLGIFLERLFDGPQGFFTAGVPLEIDGRVVLIYSRLRWLMSDGAGHRKTMNWRGW